jgi:hypothetical protein
MTIRLIEGFDYYPNIAGTAGVNSAWTFDSTASVGLIAGRFGGQALAGTAGSSVTRTLTRTVPATTTAAAGAALRMNGTPTVAFYLCAFRSSGGIQCGVGVGTDNRVRAFGSGTGTVLGAATDPLATGAWHYIEAEVTIHDTTGVAKVWVNGTLVINLANVDTKGQAQSDITQFNIFATSLGSSNSADVDDVYVTDSTRLGECRVITLYPTADTADSDWTPSTGSDNFAMVDETTVNGDTDYVAASAVGDLDFYTLGNLAAAPLSIFAVQAKICARKDDAATREIRTRIRSNGDVANGATVGLAASYTYLSDIFETDPDTALAWTAAGVNALEVGQEVMT